jgi:hypothetical protein
MLVNDADTKFGEQLHQTGELVEHVCRIEVLPVQGEHDRPLAAVLQALSDCRFQQSDAVRRGKRGDDHEEICASDIVSNTFEVLATHGGCEKLHVHVNASARKTFRYYPRP